MADTPFIVTLVGGELKLVGLWSDVLAYAVALCVEANESGSPLAPVRIALVRVELLEDSATLQFERRCGGSNNVPESRFAIGYAVARVLVGDAVAPEVWQAPLKQVVQRLLAEVPAFGGVVHP